jgi:hypothetical protein
MQHEGYVTLPVNSSVYLPKRMRKFEFVKDLSERFSGKAHLFRVDPPVEYAAAEDEAGYASYVVASATMVPLRGPATMIFPADERGELLDWGEIGGKKGTLDIDAVMSEWAGTPATREGAGHE